MTLQSPRFDYLRLHDAPRSPSSAVIPVGTVVDIWCKSLRSWSSGFVVVDVNADGWRVRRLSDSTELPVRFAGSEIRTAADTTRP